MNRTSTSDSREPKCGSSKIDNPMACCIRERAHLGPHRSPTQSWDDVKGGGRQDRLGEASKSARHAAELLRCMVSEDVLRRVMLQLVAMADVLEFEASHSEDREPNDGPTGAGVHF